MLICAVASLLLVLAGALVMDWYRLTLETADGVTRAIIDLRSVRACSPGHPCTTQSLTRMAGMFPTLAAVTLWSSVGFAGLVSLQAGARVFTGGAYEVFTKLGYMLALMAISLTVATAYMFGPESHGVAAALASRPGIELHRTWGPLTLIIGLSLGFAAIYLAVSRESSDLGAAYKPVTIPPGASQDARERAASNRAPASAKLRTGPVRIDPAGPARSPRGASAAEPPSMTPKASTSGAMTAIERRDPAGLLRLARESAAARRRELLGGTGGRSATASERRDASVAARLPRGPGSDERREPAGRPATTRDLILAEPIGRGSEHSLAARLEPDAYGAGDALPGPRERIAEAPSSLRPTRDLQPMDMRAPASPSRRPSEHGSIEGIDPGVYRRGEAGASDPRDAGGLGLVATRTTRDLRAPERREHVGALRHDDAAAERREPSDSQPRDELAAETAAPRAAAPRSETGAEPRERSGPGPAGHRVTREFRSVERHELIASEARGEPASSEPRERTGTGLARDASAADRREQSGAFRRGDAEPRERTGTGLPRDASAADRREQSGTYRRGDAEPRERTGSGVPRDASAADGREQSGTYRRGDAEPRERTGSGVPRGTRELTPAERLEQSGAFRRGDAEPRERTGSGVPRGTRELTPAERLEQSGTYRRGEPGSGESTMRTAREINSAEHRDYTGVRPGELGSVEARESTGVHREQTGGQRSAERAGSEVREQTGAPRGAELRGGVQIGVLRVRTQPSAARAASDSPALEPPEHTGMTRVASDDAIAAPREQTGVGRTPRGTASAVPREQTGTARPIGSTQIGVLRAAPDAGAREQTGVRAVRGTTSIPEREQSGAPRAPSVAPEPAGSLSARAALPSPPEHLRNQLAYVALTAELGGGGIDARREDGAVRMVLWRDIVGVVARRMPPDAGGAPFVDIVSTAGSTLRIVPWTRLSGDLIDADGDNRPRAVVEHIVARCPSVRIDPATQHFLDTGEPAQLPDLETLRAHDSRLA